MDTRFAISEYLDAAQVTAQLDALIKKPIYSISPAALKKYEEEYFDKKCAKSKAMITEAREIIPGGVQHNLAFNYPFPIVMTKAKGAKLYDIDGNEYYDFLQAGGPTILGSNDDVVKEKVKELLDDCGPSTGLFHEYEYKLAKKISDCVPSVEMFRMLGSGTEACMCAVRVARLATGHKNIIKMGGAYHGWSDQLAWGMRVPGTLNLQSHGVPLFVFKHTQEFFPNDLKSLAVSIQGQISYRSSIQISLPMFKFIYDLHRTIFRSPCDRPAWKCCFQKVYKVFALFQSSLDVRDEVKNSRVFFYCKKFCHLHAARFTHPIQVISFQIDDHQEFTLVLLRVFQFGTHQKVFFQSRASFSCTFDRSCVDVTFFHLEKTFRGSADDLEIAIIHVSAER